MLLSVIFQIFKDICKQLVKHRSIWQEYDFGFEPSEDFIFPPPFSYLLPVKLRKCIGTVLMFQFLNGFTVSAIALLCLKADQGCVTGLSLCFLST